MRWVGQLRRRGLGCGSRRSALCRTGGGVVARATGGAAPRVPVRRGPRQLGDRACDQGGSGRPRLAGSRTRLGTTRPWLRWRSRRSITWFWLRWCSWRSITWFWPRWRWAVDHVVLAAVALVAVDHVVLAALVLVAVDDVVLAAVALTPVRPRSGSRRTPRPPGLAPPVARAVGLSHGPWKVWRTGCPCGGGPRCPGARLREQCGPCDPLRPVARPSSRRHPASPPWLSPRSITSPAPAGARRGATGPAHAGAHRGRHPVRLPDACRGGCPAPPHWRSPLAATPCRHTDPPPCAHWGWLLPHGRWGRRTGHGGCGDPPARAAGSGWAQIGGGPGASRRIGRTRCSPSRWSPPSWPAPVRHRAEGPTSSEPTGARSGAPAVPPKISECGP